MLFQVCSDDTVCGTGCCNLQTQQCVCYPGAYPLTTGPFACIGTYSK